MFRTLQSRLWLTYVVLILTVLSILAVGIFVYVVRHPVVDRQTLQQLDVTSRVIKRLFEQGKFRNTITQRRIENLSEQFAMRIMIFDVEGREIFDSDQGAGEFNWRRLQSSIPGRGLIRDDHNQTWLFTTQKLRPDNTLFLAAPRQGGLSFLRSPQFREVLRDEFLPPFIRAGAAALVLALILAYGMSRWISSPISDITHAARKVTEGEYHAIDPQGPSEVRSLTRTFNEMLHQVQTSQQSQQDFVANVSHELKTPLTSIQGFAQAMIDGTVTDVEDMRQSARVIQDEAQRMYRLVLDLLELARYDAGTVQLDRTNVDLEQLLVQTMDKLSLQADQKGITLLREVAHLPLYHGDPDRLSQVFSNMIDNAIKYTPSGGEVKVTGKVLQDRVEIGIVDTGQGIPAHEMERIFDRFYQVDKSRGHDQDPSSGLGLAIAREIVQTHGGSIHVRSEPEGGSQFLVYLPLTHAVGVDRDE